MTKHPKFLFIKKSALFIERTIYTVFAKIGMHIISHVIIANLYEK